MVNLIRDYKMPRYNELPKVGLYLEQAVSYINDCLEPLGLSITSSMISNYVKKGYISKPIKKQYTEEHLAYVLFIAVAKNAISIDNIASLFSLQKRTYPLNEAYDYFCTELENMLKYIFKITNVLPDVTQDVTYAKKTLRSVIIAVSNIIYLNYCFDNKLIE